MAEATQMFGDDQTAQPGVEQGLQPFLRPSRFPIGALRESCGYRCGFASERQNPVEFDPRSPSSPITNIRKGWPLRKGTPGWFDVTNPPYAGYNGQYVRSVGWYLVIVTGL